MRLSSLRSFRFMLFLLLVALVLGCGGGGGGGRGTKTASFKVRIEWGARSRAVGLSSALSARVTLARAGGDGNDIVWTVNRPVTAAGVPISQVYEAPASATLGSHNLGVVFYAQANATGDAVGTAGAVAEIAEGQANELSLSTYAGVDAVRVLPSQSVKVGETKELLIEAKNASGTVVALSTGSAFFTITSGTASLEIVNNGSAVRGKAPSTSAEVTVRVDQVTSAATVVKVTSDTTVTVSPETGTLGSEFTLELSAVVGGAPETGVQFAVEGGAANGTLESVATNSATYVAPKVTGATSRVCKVIVTSNYDPGVSKTISVTVEPRVSVALTPTNPTATRNGTTTLSATVSNLSPRVPTGDRGVIWRVLDDGSGQPVGSITSAGIYTAPNRDGTFTVEATSVYDPTKKASIGVVVVRGPSFTELPLPDGATLTTIVDLSEDGQVVALDVTNPLFMINPTRSYLWTEAGGYSQIGMASITAISGDGSVAVGYVDLNTETKPARWTKASGLQILDRVGSVGCFNDLSNNGKIAILVDGTHSNLKTYIWDDGVISSASMFSYNLSGDGTTLVGFRLQGPYFAEVPVRWTSAEGVQDLPLLDGTPAGHARLVSPNGNIITGDDGSRAWRWTRSGGMTNLGKLPGMSSSWVTGMSPDGTVVFMASHDGSSNPPRYGVWIEGRGLISLADFIAEKGFASSLSGWQEVGINRCSADNKTFLGYGKNPSGRWSVWVMRL